VWSKVPLNAIWGLAWRQRDKELRAEVEEWAEPLHPGLRFG
jgi:hypothetical protein